MLKYARWALERDEKIAVKIFTARRTPEQPSERMKPESVINFLSPFATATISYLEYLVHDKGLKVSLRVFHRELLPGTEKKNIVCEERFRLFKISPPPPHPLSLCIKPIVPSYPPLLPLPPPLFPLYEPGIKQHCVKEGFESLKFHPLLPTQPLFLHIKP